MGKLNKETWTIKLELRRNEWAWREKRIRDLKDKIAEINREISRQQQEADNCRQEEDRLLTEGHS